ARFSTSTKPRPAAVGVGAGMRSRTAYPILLNPGILAKVGLKRPFPLIFSHGWHGFTRMGHGRSHLYHRPLRGYDGRCPRYASIPARLLSKSTSQITHV